MNDAPALDSRAAQIERVAAYLERHPGATLRQIEGACDTGSITKVLSVMRSREVGYVLRCERHPVPCNRGRNVRQVFRVWLIARPSPASQTELFTCP
jgi:hypothetical protein